MASSDTARSTPLTHRADRSDERVRLIEEAVLLIRGEWPAVAAGLCESVNRASGLIFVPAAELDEAIETTAEEALRVVGKLYGHESVLAVREAAAAGEQVETRHPVQPEVAPRPRTRGSLRPRRRVHARAGW